MPVEVSTLAVPAPLGREHLDAVAEIHAEALAGDFLPSLGPGFLRAFYRAALLSGAAFGFVLLDAGRPAGFVLGSEDTGRLFRRILLRAPLALALAALPAVLRRPALLARVAETFLYPRRESAGDVPAELVVIAVDASLRGRGAGAALVAALTERLRRSGISIYKVTVLQSNPGANRFYQRLGFQKAGEFRMYGKMWNLYIYKI